MHGETKDTAKETQRTVLKKCKVCGKPKAMTYISGVISVDVNCQCDCEKAKFDREKEEWAEKQRRSRISNLRAAGIQDKERRKCTFDVAEPNKHISMCRKYVSDWPEMKQNNIGMLLWGVCGNGKSFASACIANALIDQGIPVLMTSFPAILNDNIKNYEIAQMMREFDLVILDDLGAERQSEYAMERVFYTIDERYKSRKPLIVTTNQPLQTMKEYRNGTDMKYARIYDRILEMCVPIQFDAPARRRDAQRQKVKVFGEFLSKA